MYVYTFLAHLLISLAFTLFRFRFVWWSHSARTNHHYRRCSAPEMINVNQRTPYLSS